MRLIIKQFTGQMMWSSIFCVGTHACEEGGQLSNTVLEKMRSHDMIPEIDHTEIIESFPHHETLIKEVHKCKYYEIRKSDSTPTNIPGNVYVNDASIPVVPDLEKICLECGHKGTPKNKFIFSDSKFRKRQIKYSTHCEKCDAEINYSRRFFTNPRDEQREKDLLEAAGEKWSEEIPLPN